MAYLSSCFRLLKSSVDTAQGLGSSSARPRWDTAQEVDAHQGLAHQDLSKRLLEMRQVLAQQDPQEPHDACQVLVHQDLSGRLLKTSTHIKYSSQDLSERLTAQDLDARQVLVPQDLGGTLLKTA
jgi:hypothetical protein